ncbi:lysozyme [Allopusillimonas soli]|uniref:Glycoside hydrolase family 104 protein n=1 Tax=Allopusillimonas soli TaxID=659016 RepID=A0A853FFK2_9BURK|nr:glycoside hydrolase family 104 protein [Allopusillimonas soli]NYT38853.1 glycoside hydrolase family 104 protein [Allopusillimonas soli]TEA70147.1 lysozyme [Allopusillimonas soli]
MPRITPEQAGGANVCAFLDAIAFTEGTDNNRQPTNDDGYDVLVGGTLFTDYSRHPNKLVRLSASLSSTAAGRYQILYRFWKAYQQRLRLPDFSPLSQDLYAINQLKEQRAYGRILAGEFEKAVLRVNDIWASLPESPYGQHTYSMSEMKAVYIMHGGTYV